MISIQKLHEYFEFSFTKSDMLAKYFETTSKLHQKSFRDKIVRDIAVLSKYQFKLMTDSHLKV